MRAHMFLDDARKNGFHVFFVSTNEPQFYMNTVVGTSRGHPGKRGRERERERETETETETETECVREGEIILSLETERGY